jgi:nucleotide sugar dehydrogenase
MGKIGLPLAVQFASKGHFVFGTDVNKNTIDLINSGKEPFPDEAELATKLQQVVSTGHLVGTTNTTEVVSKSDVVVIVVPLFVDSNGIPDFNWMDSATRDVGRGLQKGSLVSYETTLPVGTTRNRFAKILEEESGLKAGTDFYLAFSPERVFTGRVFADLRKYPKLVGGINKASGDRAKAFYEKVLDFDERSDLNKPNGVWDLGSSEASEMAKLAETTYRDVNIGLANQFAKFSASHNINIYQVIEACNSQPFSHIHQPGIAVGGHCIPIYPQMYLWSDPEATIVRFAREANTLMPEYAVGELQKLHGSLKGQKVVVLGAAYRGGVKETAFSGVFATVDSLKSLGAKVVVHDPMYSDQELENLGFEPFHLGEVCDAAMLQTNHDEYFNLSSKDLPNAKTVFDGRNIINHENFQSLKLATIGKPS